MNTPICDFVRNYTEKEGLRLHMPGHKGCCQTGPEKYDITEIEGADALYEAKGIIAESEKNAGKLFGCNTFYSTEGSSQCIRAMLYLAVIHARQNGKKPLILAARNVHKAFVSAAVLLDFDYTWIYPQNDTSYLSCKINGEILEKYLCSVNKMPTALYLTSPDYLGNVSDIKSVSAVCKKHGILLIVDNAHGAYLGFLSHSRHPIHLGADICCDSAHKTLPVLTGGAYLHISVKAPSLLTENAKSALALFGSTSPSYLILQSLDKANAYLSDSYTERLEGFVSQVDELRKSLVAHGYSIIGQEPLKITVSSKPYGYKGTELADILNKQNIVCEFADDDFIVFMLTPETSANGLEILEKVLCSVPKKEALLTCPPGSVQPERVMSAREAAFLKSRVMSIDKCENMILAETAVGCPPAVPIVISGERISKEAIDSLRYYGFTELKVII